MSPDEQPINNQFTMQQPYMDVNGLATTRRISQESSMVSQRTTIFTKDAHKIQQMSPRMPSYVKKMIHASLACGVIIVIGTVLVAIGLATGAFTSNQGFAMVSSLLIGVAYNAVRISFIPGKLYWSWNNPIVPEFLHYAPLDICSLYKN